MISLEKSPQVLVILHIKPHAEKEGLKSANARKYEGHGVNIRNIPCGCPDVKETDRQG